MKNPHKALEAIEILVGGSFGMDMDCYVYGMMKPKNTEDTLMEAAKLITKIYMIAHAEVSRGCSHEDWEKIKYRVKEEDHA